MNYKESQEILEEIKKAKRILVNCHKSPDPDSVGSALAFYSFLKTLGKEAKIICPGEKINRNLSFLKDFEKIEIVDFPKFDFSRFDLFIALDSSSWSMVSGDKSISLPKLPMIVIDHHKTNEKYGKINLVDDKVSSTGELLYRVFSDWKVKITENIATPLLTGIIGDTGAFQYPGTYQRTLEVAGSLMEEGADKDEIILNIYRSAELKLLKFWGEVLRNIRLNETDGFVWSAIPYEKFVELGKPDSGRESSASMFMQIVKNTEFGIVMVEQEKGRLSISLRSRTGFDTTKISTALGGGGHIYASGARIEGLPFKKAVEKVLAVARKFARKG